jgi:hypothetical protein
MFIQNYLRCFHVLQRPFFGQNGLLAAFPAYPQPSEHSPERVFLTCPLEHCRPASPNAVTTGSYPQYLTLDPPRVPGVVNRVY